MTLQRVIIERDVPAVDPATSGDPGPYQGSAFLFNYPQLLVNRWTSALLEKSCPKMCSRVLLARRCGRIGRRRGRSPVEDRFDATTQPAGHWGAYSDRS